MDIQQVNSVLSRAIMGLQGAEIEAMAEATAVGRTSYTVPSPGLVGPRAKQKSKPKGGAKWTKGSIDLAQMLGGKQMMDSVPAHLFGVWAVHKEHGSWKISHAPTGMNAFSGFKAKDTARAAVEKMIEEFPDLLMIGKNAEPGEGGDTVARMSPYLSRMQELVRQTKERGGWEYFNKKLAAKAPRKRKPLKAVESVGGKWVKAAFLGTTEKGKASEPTAAMMRGVWAVHKAENDPDTPSWRKERGWIVSHAPTGYRVFSRFGTQKHAKAAVDEIIDVNPELISMAKTGGADAARKQLLRYRGTIGGIVSKHGGR